MFLHTGFIKFRFGQFSKFIREFPPLYLLIFLLMTGSGVYYCYQGMQSRATSLFICTGIIIILLYRQLQRKDYHFIYLIEEQPWKIFLSDYLLFLFPFFVLTLLQQQWIAATGLIAGSVVISFIRQPFRQISKGVPVPAFIPQQAFELRSGFRQYGLILSILYIAAWIGLIVPYLSLGLIWFYTAFFNSFFTHHESKAILISQEKPVRFFLMNKLRLNVSLYAVTILPVCIVYTVLYSAQWWYVLYFALTAFLTIALQILIKYSTYEPGKQIISGQLPGAFGFLSIIIPIFLPFTVLFLFKYYRKAFRQLNPYLYAYH